MRQQAQRGRSRSRNRLQLMSIRSSLGEPRRSHAESLHRLSIVMAALTGRRFAGCSRNPDAAKSKYLESGMKYMDQQKYDSAAIQFKKALQIDPSSAEAHYQLGQADSSWRSTGRRLQRIQRRPSSRTPTISRPAWLWATMWWPASEFLQRGRRTGPLRGRARSQQRRRIYAAGQCAAGPEAPQDAIDAYNKAIALEAQRSRRLPESRRGLRLH